MGKNIIHLEFIEAPQKGKRHHYFGSKAAIYKVFTHEDIGIGYTSLCNLGDLTAYPYGNSKCIIRQGEVLTSERNNKNR